MNEGSTGHTSLTGPALVAILSLTLSPLLNAQAVLINEIAPHNSFPDFGLEPPDWIEFFNPTTEGISLEGWFLTDDPLEVSKWRFPAVTIESKSFLRIFCSGKDLLDAEGEIHTNFQLDRDGDYLAMARPDGEIEDQIAPFYPAIPKNMSYGRRQNSTPRKLLSFGSEVRYFVPRDSSLEDTWTDPDFDDSAWSTGVTALGFDFKTEPTIVDLVTTDVRDGMQGVNSTLYVRATFKVENVQNVGVTQLRVHFEDGFVAFINGVEVARRNAPDELEHDSRATDSQQDRDVLKGEQFIIKGHREFMRDGQNVLAIHALNNGRSSRDFLIQIGMDAFQLLDTEVHGFEFFETPSPESPNGSGFPGSARMPQASHESSLVTEAFELELTSPDGGEIRYTVNGDPPDRESELYTGPIRIETSTRVRARSIAPGLAWSPVAAFGFPLLDANTSTFNSNLPLLVIETFGVAIPEEPKIPGYVHIADIDSETKRSNLSDEPQYFGPMGIERRGSSTIGRIKASYSLETRDLDDADFDVALLGMPAESDWVLYGPLEFDRAMVRNPFLYAISNQIGLYAVRTRFVEVFVNLDASKIDRSNDYYGVYVFMEKIKRGPHRVDVETIPRTAREEPEITGGYVLKRDRPGPEDVGFGDSIQHVYPKEENIPSHQLAWLEGYFRKFNAALSSPNFADPVNGYAKFTDVDSAIDFHILNELTKNPDGFVVSTYFYKPRGKPIHWGPIWDFDRTMGPDLDARARDPIGWSAVRKFGWWGRFFDDPAFVKSYKQRWEELRGQELSEKNLLALVDSQAIQITEAQSRNYQRWTGLVNPDGGWETEVQQLKTWIKQRLNWMDTQLFDPPRMEPEGGLVTLPLEITIDTPSGVGEIYYTLNGSDPRRPDDTLDPAAVLHDGLPIVTEEPTRVRARVRLRPRVWSGLTDVGYYDSHPSLAITEVMYNPPDDQKFEFIEIHNFGETPVRLHGVEWLTIRQSLTISEGPEFLPPGAFTVLARSSPDFSARYNADEGMNKITISGEYSRTLSDTGERLVLRGHFGEPVLDFSYRDSWHASTDGGGHSLVLVDPRTPADQYGLRDSWRPSFFPDGSPGQEDPTEFPMGSQLPGDSNQDAQFNISDALRLMILLFNPEGAKFPCENGKPTDIANLRVLDSNLDFRIDISDVIYNLFYLFGDGPAPRQGATCFGLRDCPDICDNGS